ncbi:High mobility group box domain [Trinorchestia longiramus]|nr:High mobility group box domain [Trinorchestia longiramus]
MNCDVLCHCLAEWSATPGPAFDFDNSCSGGLWSHRPQMRVGNEKLKQCAHSTGVLAASLKRKSDLRDASKGFSITEFRFDLGRPVTERSREGQKAAEKIGLGAGGAGSSLFSLYNNGQHFGQPPPAHMGISPYPLDPKAGLRPPVYPFTASQYSYHLGADFTQMATWFSTPSLMPPHPGLTPPLPHSLVASPKAADLPNTSHDNHRHPGMLDGKTLGSPHDKSLLDEKKPHIKKPLNAFMLYMKEMRAQVVAECTLKESAAINQILGRKWHALSKEEQAKYYDMARRERQVHMQMYPGWNARDNYGMMKKKKRKKEKSVDGECFGSSLMLPNVDFPPQWHALTREEQAKYYEMSRKERQLHMQMYPGWSSRQNYSQGKKKKRNRDKNTDGANMKKCRARYGLDQQNQWCKPCSPATVASLVASATPGGGGGSNALLSGVAAAAAAAAVVATSAGAGPVLVPLSSCPPGSVTSLSPLVSPGAAALSAAHHPYSPLPPPIQHSIVNLSCSSNSSNNSSSGSSASSTNSSNSTSTNSSSSSSSSSCSNIGSGGSCVASPAEPTYVNL